MSHRRTLDLSDELAVPVVTVVGHLACLWLWALDNAPDGDVCGIKPRTLARAALWEGDPESFVASLRAAGYVDPDGRLHDWDDYAGRLIDQRTRNAEKQKRWREAHKPVTSLPISSSRDGHVAVTSPSRTAATVPNPTVPTSPDGDAPAVTAPDAAPAPVAALQDEAASEPPVRAVPKPKRERAPGHAAVRLYRRATEINPKEGVRQQIEEAVDAEDEDALGRWQHVLQEWLSRGYSAKNVAGLLDWFADGIPQRKRPVSVGPPGGASERGYVPNPGPPPVAWDDAKAAASDAERKRTRQELIAGGVLSGRRPPPSVNGTSPGTTKPPPDPAAAEERLREKERKLLADGVLTAEQVATARRARQPAHAAAAGAHP